MFHSSFEPNVSNLNSLSAPVIWDTSHLSHCRWRGHHSSPSHPEWRPGLLPSSPPPFLTSLAGFIFPHIPTTNVLIQIKLLTGLIYLIFLVLKYVLSGSLEWSVSNRTLTLSLSSTSHSLGAFPHLWHRALALQQGMCSAHHSCLIFSNTEKLRCL